MQGNAEFADFAIDAAVTVLYQFHGGDSTKMAKAISDCPDESCPPRTKAQIAKSWYLKFGESLALPGLGYEFSIGELARHGRLPASRKLDIQSEKDSEGVMIDSDGGEIILDLRGARIASLDGLAAIPGIAEVEILLLSGNMIAELAPGAFSAARGLRQLSLDDNRLFHIGAGAFAGLGNLNTLDLSNNQISVIDPGAFAPLGGLDSLYLGGNRISRLHPKAFDGLAGLGDTLDLSHNLISDLPFALSRVADISQRLDLSYNLIEALPEGSFCEMRYLWTLDLSHNRLKALPRLFKTSAAMNLHHFFAYHNDIETVAIDAFVGANSVQTFGLSYNRLAELSLQIFSSDGSCVSINLEHNGLKDISLGSCKIAGRPTIWIGTNELSAMSLSTLRFMEQSAGLQVKQEDHRPGDLFTRTTLGGW